MATVIKAGEAATLLKRLSTVDLADHLKEANKVVVAASQRAAKVVADAEARAEKVWESARQAGYDIGYEEGRQTGMTSGHDDALCAATKRFEQEHATIVADMERVVSEIDGIRKDLRIAAERDLLEFAVQIATRMTFSIGRLHREAVVENVRRAIRQVGEKTDLTIRLHPADRTFMETFADSMLKRLDVSDAVQLIEDASIAPGGCIVETDRTRIDATLETQVAQIVSLLLGDGSSQAADDDQDGQVE